MTTEPTKTADLWERLTRPFAPDEIEKLPKNVRRDDQDRGTCERGSCYSADGTFCGKYHARAVHLDYVGHAGIVMRLNDVLGPEGWTFEPFAVDGDGMPIMSTATFYGRLTIMGTTKWDVAANFTGPQEAYGDCLRRCAMRFGIGTYLWSKSESAANKSADVAPPDAPQLEPFQQSLLDFLSTLSEPTAEQVRTNWPYTGRGPSMLTEEECAEVRGLVEMVLAANLEES